MHPKGDNHCIFCKIVAKAAPADVLSEDADNLIFLPIEQEVFGHALIVPKAHYETLRDMPIAALGSLMQFVQKTANYYKNIFGTEEFNLLNASGLAAQQSVAHVHFHYFPRFPNDGIDTWPRLPELAHESRAEFLMKVRT